MSNATQNLALRRLATEQRIDSHRIQQYLETLDVLPAQRYEHTPLLGRILGVTTPFHGLRCNLYCFSGSDRRVLYTCDGKLKKGHRRNQ